MANIDYGRAAGYFLLTDFIKGFKLGFKYFFAPKATLSRRILGTRYAAIHRLAGLAS